MRAKEHLTKLLKDFVSARGLDWPDKAVVEPPKDKRFGDLATNLALVLAGQAQAKPRDLAAELSRALAEDPLLDAVEVAGPGFCNVSFRPAFWQDVAGQVLAQEDGYGRSDLGKGRRVQVEYVSANPTGPLHVGHGRGAAVGDSLARILRFTGHDVSTEYYINDAGRQMLLLGRSVWTRVQEALGRAAALPEDGYRGDYIKDVAAEVVAKTGPAILDMAEEEAVAVCREHAIESILGGIKDDLATFRAEHQVWFSEKSLVNSDAVEETFQFLRKADLAYDKDGALWFRAVQFGDGKDRVLRKSDGSLTYFASDIAYHDHKYHRGFDLVIDVWGADHHGYVPRMKAAVEALGRSRDDLQVVLVQLVNLLVGGEQVAMSTRAGKFETLADVCAEVGVDAARYIFLTRKSDSHLDVDLELLASRSMDNPVYYVQYAHARICSMMRKADERGLAPGAPSSGLLALLDTPEDLALLRLMEQFPDAAVAAAESLSPHHVSYYLGELASALHRYYTVHQVLGAPEEDLIRARMQLMLAVAQVLRNGLALLGVQAPESM